MQQGWGEPQIDRSIREKPLSIAGKKFAHGVGTHATSVLWIQLDGRTERFQATVGVDDAAGGPGTVVFHVFGDGKELWTSGVMKPNEKAKTIDLDLRGVKLLLLLVDDAGDGINFDHADWANARFTFHGRAPQAIDPPRPPEEKAVLLTPPPGPAPKINGPKIYACGPTHPFLYRIPATGRRPMKFSAEGLPAGLVLDADAGIIRGKIAKKGEYRVTLRAKNGQGQAERPLKIVCGDMLALTPPMGWNSWYIHYNRVTEVHLREAAKQMIASGMADYGYQYVNIDDCWMKKQGDKPYRDAAGAVLPNAKFPDIKGMVDEIHAAGLKAGVYTSPGPWTCGGYVGAYRHEAADARRFAQWGFDFLKYDWCSYGEVAGGNDLAHLKKPYQVIAAELKKQDRDIVLNLCQYGMGEVWKWGGEVGQCWRTTGDLGLERGGRLPGFYSIGFSNAQHWENAGPGCWNDPDYLLIGYVGDAARWARPQDDADAQRAIRLHVDVVPDGLAADLQRRHGPARSVHAQRALQCGSDRCRPGREGPAGSDHPQDAQRVHSLEGPRRWFEGPRAFQPGRGRNDDFRGVGRPGAQWQAAGPRFVAARRPACGR